MRCGVCQKEGDDLIHPCHCYIHPSCLENERYNSSYACSRCGQNYYLKLMPITPSLILTLLRHLNQYLLVPAIIYYINPSIIPTISIFYSVYAYFGKATVANLQYV